MRVRPPEVLRCVELRRTHADGRFGGSDGDRCTETVIGRYLVPHNILSVERLREIAASATEMSISEASRRHKVARQTVKRALALYGPSG
jgi:hypothetical protein